MSDWSPSETLRVGQDPGGSRVLEALVTGSTTSKAKKKLLRKLKGMWGILALEPGGSHVVESCFSWGVSNFMVLVNASIATSQRNISHAHKATHDHTTWPDVCIVQDVYASMHDTIKIHDIELLTISNLHHDNVNCKLPWVQRLVLWCSKASTRLCSPILHE